MSTDFLWVEEYRPKTINDCILPTSLKTLFKSFIQKGELSNLLFSGTPGIGKTTVAKALCEELNCDWIMINGSEEGGIDVAYTGLTQDSGAKNGEKSTQGQNTQSDVQTTESEDSSDLTDNQLTNDGLTRLDIRV